MERRNIRDCRVGDFILDRHPGPKDWFVWQGRSFRATRQTFEIAGRQGHRKIVIRES